MFTLVATMFVAFGLFELFGRHVVNYVRRHRTSYALTTHRVFIRTGVFRQVTRQRNLTPGDPPEFSIGSNGTGTIVFAPPETTPATQHEQPRRGAIWSRRSVLDSTDSNSTAYRMPIVSGPFWHQRLAPCEQFPPIPCPKVEASVITWGSRAIPLHQLLR